MIKKFKVECQKKLQKIIRTAKNYNVKKYNHE